MFLSPEALVLLLLLPIIGGFQVWRGRKRQQRILRFGDAERMTLLSRNISPVQRRLQTALWYIAATAVIVALARPAWGLAVETVETRGVAVIMVLDVSRSMDAVDMGGLSRLERAQIDLESLLDTLEGHAVGLVIFAGRAYVQLPLTTDLFSAKLFLQATSSNAITQQGTALGDAIELAVEMVDERVADSTIIIVASDGENHLGDPLLAAEAAAEKGIVIHTLGYGTTEGATIPVLRDDGFTDVLTDESGAVVFTRLQEDILQDIAQLTGGSYQQADAAGLAISTIAQYVKLIEADILGESVVTRLVERFEIFVAIAVLAILSGLVLSQSSGRMAK